MKRISSLLSILLLLAGTGNLWAVSEAGVLFLLISPTARAGGMGEAFAGIADDASASYFNPAGLAFQEGRQFTSMYSKWLPQFNLSDLYYLFGAYRQSIKGLGTIGFNVTYINLGEQQQTLETGPEPVGTFNSNEYSLAASYSTLLTESFGLGLNLKYIRSNLSGSVQVGAEKTSGTANAFAIDVGILKKNLLLNRLNLGINLANLGPRITYVDASQADPLPTNLRVGLAYGLIEHEHNRLILAFDVNKLLVNVSTNEAGERETDSVMQAVFSSWSNSDYIFNMGAEYWYASLIALRAGYNYDDAGKVKYLTIGAGLKYAIYQFDFGYITAAGQNHPLSDTMRFSLTIGQ
jgi:long-subunit fatty acid transport protein